MSQNDVILLNTILEQQKTDDFSQSEFFEFFSFEQLLKKWVLPTVLPNLNLSLIIFCRR